MLISPTPLQTPADSPLPSPTATSQGDARSGTNLASPKSPPGTGKPSKSPINNHLLKAAVGGGQPAETASTGNSTGMMIFKVVIFWTLALQNSLIVLLTRWRKLHTPDAHKSDNDALVVVWGEILKLWLSVVVLVFHLLFRNPFNAVDQNRGRRSIHNKVKVDEAEIAKALGSANIINTAAVIQETSQKTEKDVAGRRSTIPGIESIPEHRRYLDCEDWEDYFQLWCQRGQKKQDGPSGEKKPKDDSKAAVVPKGKEDSSSKDSELRNRKKDTGNPSSTSDRAEAADDEDDWEIVDATEPLPATYQNVADVLNRFLKSPKHLRLTFQTLVSAQLLNYVEFFLMMVPGCIYLFQNRLIFFAYSKLPGPVFQVTYQLKILTGAFVARFVLGQVLSWRKWLALVLLVIGVVTVQVDGHAFLASLSDNATLDFVFGICASVVACLCSGCAGVYFEKVLKGGKVNLWVRNVHLAIASVIIGAGGNVLERAQRDRPELQENVWPWFEYVGTEFFPAFYREITVVPNLDGIVWTIIWLHSVGGLLVSLLIKYMNNTMKAFAASCAILIASLVSVYMFPDFQLSPLFGMGFTLVAAAIYLYMN